MAINFPSNTITEVGLNRITYPQNLIQVVNNEFTANLNTNNWSTQNEIATVSITPTSASSKILIYVMIHYNGYIAQGNWSLGYFWLRNNTNNTELTRSGWNGTWRHSLYSWSKHFLDSPGTTATQTYSLRVGNYPTGAHGFNTSGSNHDGKSYIRAMEFAG